MTYVGAIQHGRSPSCRLPGNWGSQTKSFLFKKPYLTLSGGLDLESSDKLFQFFLTTFRAFRLPSVVLSDAEIGSKLLFALRASVVVAGHLLSLSFLYLILINSSTK